MRKDKRNLRNKWGDPLGGKPFMPDTFGGSRGTSPNFAFKNDEREYILISNEQLAQFALQLVWTVGVNKKLKVR